MAVEACRLQLYNHMSYVVRWEIFYTILLKQIGYDCWFLIIIVSDFKTLLDSKHSFHLQQTKIKIRICIWCSFRVLPIVYLICIQIKTFVLKPLYRYISYNCFFTMVLFNTSSIPLLHWIICIRIDRSNKLRSFDFWSCIIWLHSCCINFYFQWVIFVPDNILLYSPFYCYYWIWLNKTTVYTNWSLKVPNEIILSIR